MNHFSHIGLRFGILALVYYATATYAKYQYFSNNLYTFSLASIIIYIIFMVIWLLALIRATRDRAIAEIHIKDLFRTIFIVIILGEIGFGLINYLYPFHIQPDFFATFYQQNAAWMADHSRWPQAKQDETLNSILDQKNVSWKQILQGFGQNIIIDSIIAFIIVMIYRKAKAPIRYTQHTPNTQ